MAALPSPNRVSGKHDAIYEAYYKQVDPKGIGTIEAMDAAKFLKKSGLSDVVLSRIWDLSDPRGRGCLDKAGFFVALKLVALAQHGHDINMRNIFMETPNPPKVGEIPKIMPQAIQSVPASNTDWSMKPSEKLKYENLFDSLQPENGLIPGNKVKGVLMESKLPLETLGKIWDLADQDKDGSLDKHEFTVAMHLVYQTLDKRAVPTTLPPELRKLPKTNSLPKAPSGEGFDDGFFVANFPSDLDPPPLAIRMAPLNVQSSLSTVNSVKQQDNLSSTKPLISTDIPQSKVDSSITSSGMSANAFDWVVTPQDRIRFEVIFHDCDKDKDGLVCGLEVKNVFLQSGVPQNCLAHIWALCDINQSGKLTLDQFALAMWMVEQRKKGFEPPEFLTPNMMPPSLRGASGATATLTSGSDIPLMQPESSQPKYSNPELEMVANELEDVVQERRLLEVDITQKEADIRIKTGEIRSLQSELDTLFATLKQLENQKGEAQKRLNDLTIQAAKIREQCLKQEETINEQEGEINSKKSELQKLKDEEASLENEYGSLRKETENLSKQLQDRQLQISQVKAMVTQLLESQRQMTDSLLLCKAAIEANDSYLVSDYSLKIEPDFGEAKETLKKLNEPPKSTVNQFDENITNSTTADNNDVFGNKNMFESNGFKTDPFGTVTANDTKSKSGFDFMNAPLSGFDDAFGSSFPSTTSNQTKDPFSSSNADPFGDKKSTTTTNEPGKDDFGSDPFAILHAPTSGGQILSPNASASQKSGPPPRPESPSPALPPKKAKQPPPRPAPPRPLQGPTRPAPPVSLTTTDSFGSSSSGFADFADFDNKQSIFNASQIPYKSSTATVPKSTTSTRKFPLLPLNKRLMNLNSQNRKDIESSFEKFMTQYCINKNVTDTKISGKTAAGTTEKKMTNVKKGKENQNTDLFFPVSTSIKGKIKAPTDFVEDPFKDFRYDDPFKGYRYDDIFNVNNPFTDNDDDNNNDNDVHQPNISNTTKDNQDNNMNYNPFFEKDVNNKKDFFEKFDDNFRNSSKSKHNYTASSAFLRAFDMNLNVNVSSASDTSKSETNKSNNLFDEFEDDFNKMKITDDFKNEGIKLITKRLKELSSTRPKIESKPVLLKPPLKSVPSSNALTGISSYAFAPSSNHMPLTVSTEESSNRDRRPSTLPRVRKTYALLSSSNRDRRPSTLPRVRKTYALVSSSNPLADISSNASAERKSVLMSSPSALVEPLSDATSASESKWF